MSKDGLAETSVETTPAPEEMYDATIEQGENVARGCVKVTEIIAYDATKEERRNTENEVKKDKDGNILYVEAPRKPYFCQTKEQETIFSENNPGVRTETFEIQLLKSTAIRYLNDPENMKQFKENK